MRELTTEFDEAHINVRFIVIATSDETAAFCGRFGDAGRCLSDPEKRTYEAMGLHQFNLLRLLTDRALRRRRVENKAAGFRQNWRVTRLRDAAQLPGAAVVDSSGVVRWIHPGAHPGDLPPMRELLTVARRYAAP